MIIKQIFTELETEVKWYFNSIEEIVIVYIRNRLRGTLSEPIQHPTSWIDTPTNASEVSYYWPVNYSLLRQWGRGRSLIHFYCFTMNLFLEVLQFHVLVCYYVLEAIVLCFIPSRYRRKDVKGQIVLITGAGTYLLNFWFQLFIFVFILS